MKMLICSALLISTLILRVQAQTHYEGPITDTHVHVAVATGESGAFGAPNTIDDVLPQMQKNHITTAGIITIAQQGDMEGTRKRNDSIIALHKWHPNLIPICSVHPMDTSAAWAELARVQAQGVRIIKLHPNSQRFDVGAPEVATLAQKAGELHMALLFDTYSLTDAAELGKLIYLAVTHPQCKFIFAHMGFVHFPELLALDALKKYPWFKNNVWMDVSAISTEFGNSPFKDQIMFVIRKVGINQFLFGSDFPIFTFEESVDAVKKMGFTKEEEQKIFHDNAQHLMDVLQ
jgi:predicted TIM-barrel fold metal-dependent hydrolase